MKFATSLVLIAIASSGFVVTARADDDDRRVRIAPIDSTPLGQTYGRWATQWWQWALEIPPKDNPNSPDDHGENCAQRQVDKVWFLAGSFSSDPVERSCTIPSGKSLFFPLATYFYPAYLSDPPEQRTEAFLRSQVDCIFATGFDVRIDGQKVQHPERYFTGATGSQSPFFNAQFPPDNLYGASASEIPELALSPGVEQGYYLFVYPLKRGKHSIHLKSKAVGCWPDPNFGQDVTYYLTVN
jgi:hypothetical protein